MELLILFSKFPREGLVKTRLGASIGMKKAAMIHHGFLSNLIQEHSGREYDFLVSTVSEDDSDDFKREFDVETTVQVKGDLGARMLDAFLKFTKKYDKVIIIGSDVPDLSYDDVRFAFNKLKDFVIGPAIDGGYYLIGMRKAHDIFSGIKFSTNLVFSNTMDKILSFSKDVAVLKPMRDIDTLEDYLLFSKGE